MNWIKVRLTDISSPKQWKQIPISELSKDGYFVYGANGIIGKYKEYNHEYPTLAITCRGATCGNLHITKPKSYITANAMSIDELDSNIDINFLYYALKIRGFNDVISGSAQPQITRESLKKVLIDIPDKLEDQIRISTILSKAEALIKQRKESIDLLDEYLKSTFLEMFGDPVKNENNWKVERLDKISKLERGRFSPRPRNDPSYFDGKYPFIQTGDISRSGNRLANYTQTLNEKGIKVSKQFKKGTIVIAIVGATIGATAILEIDVYATDSIIGITSNSKYSNNVFLEFVMQFWKPVLLRNAPEAARPNINLEILNKLGIINPPIDLQNQFAQIVEKVDTIKAHYKNSLQELENLYGALSQKAFKGEMDLEKAEEMLMAAEPEVGYGK